MATRLLDRLLQKSNIPWLVEIFAAANLAFLVLDIYVAHSVNAFRHPAEWIPFFFAGGGALALLVPLLKKAPFHGRLGRYTGFVVGSLSIVVGIAGLIFHLESSFFQQKTLRSLVYSAPFVAPLAFTGLGFLLLLNRLVDHGTLEWGKWVTFLAWGGFVGNFILSLADHAQNGFFYATEWIPVAVSALAVGFLFTSLFTTVDRRFFHITLAVLALQIATGVLGFYFHAAADWHGTSNSLVDNIIFGAPIFAPLLFADLAVLGALGLWDLHIKAAASEPARNDAGAQKPLSPSSHPS